MGFVYSVASPTTPSYHPWEPTLQAPWHHHLCGKASRPLLFIGGISPEPTDFNSSSTKSGSTSKEKAESSSWPGSVRLPFLQQVYVYTEHRDPSDHILLILQKKMMILPPTMVFPSTDLQPRQLLQLLLLLNLQILLVNRIRNRLYSTPCDQHRQPTLARHRWQWTYRLQARHSISPCMEDDWPTHASHCRLMQSPLAIFAKHQTWFVDSRRQWGRWLDLFHKEKSHAASIILHCAFILLFDSFLLVLFPICWLLVCYLYVALLPFISFGSLPISSSSGSSQSYPWWLLWHAFGSGHYPYTIDWVLPTSYLVTIDFSEVLHVAEELCHSDSLRVTRCNLLPVLIGTEETAMFTFSRLIPVSELLRVTPGELNPILVTKYRAPGMFRSTLTSWIFDVTIAQATLSSCATIT